MIITSAANPRIKAALALRDRRDRERAGLTLVDGAREVRRALEAGAELHDLFVSDACADDPDCVGALRLAGRSTTVSPAVLDRLAYGERAEGVVAVIRMPRATLDAIRLPAEPLIVVLDGVEKPGNVGAVLRSADGAGADALLLADPRTDPFNPNVIRASLGTVFTVPIGVGSGNHVRAFLGRHAVRVVAARVDAMAMYTDVDLRGPCALVFGSEAEGLGPGWGEPAVSAVRLPMLGSGDSLNVSVAAAILLYEARRQRDADRRAGTMDAADRR